MTGPTHTSRPSNSAIHSARVFAGYAGWGAGQLEEELLEGSWVVVDALDSASGRDVRGWVEAWLRSTGFDTVRVEREGQEPIVVRAVPEIEKVEPTGVGDAFRAGFLAALGWGLPATRAAQVGLVMAGNGHPDISMGGGTKLSRAQNVGLAGVMADGRLRDFALSEWDVGISRCCCLP